MTSSPRVHDHHVPDLRPHWDPERRVLVCHGQIVKCFRQPAPNQILILEAFEEEGWPVHIDDPISPQGRSPLERKRRLNDVVKALNRHQVTPLIHFFCDGSGEGILWEPVSANLSVHRVHRPQHAERAHRDSSKTPLPPCPKGRPKRCCE